MTDIWIIGAGRFGKKAVHAMKHRHPHAALTVVDICPQACDAIAGPVITTICMDGIAYLHRFLKDDTTPDWIVPVIPIHMAFEWMRLKLSPAYRVEPVEIPEMVRTSLPNVYPGRPGEIFTSVASFICPENCPEPSAICTYTRNPRTQILHQTIQSLSCPPFVVVSLQSRQLAPGIGGIRPSCLWKALRTVQMSRFPVLLSTACKCHGVVQAFTAIPSGADSTSLIDLSY